MGRKDQGVMALRRTIRILKDVLKEPTPENSKECCSDERIRNVLGEELQKALHEYYELTSKDE